MRVSGVRVLGTDLSETSRDIISMQQVLGYLEESLLDVKVPDKPTDLPGKRLFTILGLEEMKQNLQFRIDDLEKMTAGALNELGNLTATMDVVTCKQQERVWKQILGNTKIMVEASAADERASASRDHEVLTVLHLLNACYASDAGDDDRAQGAVHDAIEIAQRHWTMDELGLMWSVLLPSSLRQLAGSLLEAGRLQHLN